MPSQLSRRDIPFFIVNAIDGDDAPDSEKEGVQKFRRSIDQAAVNLPYKYSSTVWCR